MQDEHLSYTINWLKNLSTNNNQMMPLYGYEVYLPNVIADYIKENYPTINSTESSEIKQYSRPFYDAAWELCRLGVLRLGVKEFLGQSTGISDGYCVTPFGKEWLSQDHGINEVPTDPNRYSRMLANFQELFDSAFYERAVEAIRCYNAQAYLACCVMCGAAIESVMLKAAYFKKSETEINALYFRKNGRSQLEKIVFENCDDYTKRKYSPYTELVKYWRDEAGHGKASLISNDEAYTSIVLLVRFAHFMKDNWSNITQTT